MAENTIDRLVHISNMLFALKEEIGSVKNAINNTKIFISAHPALVITLGKYEERVKLALEKIKTADVKDFESILKEFGIIINNTKQGDNNASK